MSFFMVDPQKIDLIWKEATSLFENTFNSPSEVHNVEDYYLPLKSGEMQLWVAEIGSILKGCLMTLVEQGTRKRALRVLYLSGESFKEWSEDMDKELTAFAVKHNCAFIEAHARAGFKKVLSGLIQDGIVYVKMIGESNG